MSNSREEQSKRSDSEQAQIYEILAREDLDEGSRSHLLKKYRGTDEGLQVLEQTLKYAEKMRIVALQRYRPDPHVRHLESDNEYEQLKKIPDRVISDLVTNIEFARLAKEPLPSESSAIYNMLAKRELSTIFRYELLKRYQYTDEGMKALTLALDYARQMKQAAIRRVKQDPEDRSGYNDYEVKTELPNRVISDLEANIKMGRLVRMRPFLDKQAEAKKTDTEVVPVRVQGMNL